MISVICPTIRKEGLEIVEKALKRQTFKDFEWLIGSSFDPEIGTAKWVKDDFEGGRYTLNRTYNRLIKESKGDLLVSWQDYTFADPTALEKFWFHFVTEPKTLVSGVGNKYESVYPELGAMTWKDPRERKDQGTYYECFPNDWEANFAAVPKQALYDIGGYDEELDAFFSMDNVSVVERIDALGKYKFMLDQTIKSYSLGHGRPKDWDKYHAMHGAYENRKSQLIRDGIWPKLNYL